MEKKRFIGLDLVRVCAILFVILHHSVTNLGLMGGDLYSKEWALSLFLRELTYSCVPLFLILSGYLQKNKKLSFSYPTLDMISSTESSVSERSLSASAQRLS